MNGRLTDIYLPVCPGIKPVDIENKEIASHQQDFDKEYSRPDAQCQPINFPLAEIDSFEWGRGPHSEIYSYFYKRFTVYTLGLLELENSQKILNIGCGWGFEEKNLVNLYNDLNIWSIDISREMIKKARLGNCPSKLCIGLAESLPFPDEMFDRIMSREVIEHVISPELMIKEIARCLKPGGLAVITTEHEASLGPAHLPLNLLDKFLAPLGLKLLKSEYKNTAPDSAQVKAFALAAGLSPADTVWDGAMYNILTSHHFQKIFKSQLPDIAHFFAWLEGAGAVDRFFCDQVKFVLHKPKAAQEVTPQKASASYSCPECRGELEINRTVVRCVSCGKKYNYLEADVIDFTSSEVRPKKTMTASAGTENNKITDKCRSFFKKLLKFFLFFIYDITIVPLAILITLYRRATNKPKLPEIIGLDDKLLKYIQ